MLEYEHIRIASRKESTMGALFRLGLQAPHASLSTDPRTFRGFVVEDQNQPAGKVMRETRIPSGRYQIKLRAEGGMHADYAKKYSWHRGMLHLQNVPGFTWVYIHTGNKESETDGCLLTGTGAFENSVGEFETTGSVAAYTRLYQEIVVAIERGEEVFIRVVDVA